MLPRANKAVSGWRWLRRWRGKLRRGQRQPYSPAVAHCANGGAEILKSDPLARTHPFLDSRTLLSPQSVGRSFSFPSITLRISWSMLR
ncbi:uncharacterized protein K441DRAFT_178931 [Cenococcum geophilum 1.58]|uniref:uncharacterized protein n=1 Tax=Cenococcum geophilum 1.58 TaxID=794803 RepID=UPI00358E3F5D|nr:hypothetical protein K441DRAFT_178931 [Cenococcum geophilum 1.58]